MDNEFCHCACFTKWSGSVFTLFTRRTPIGSFWTHGRDLFRWKMRNMLVCPLLRMLPVMGGAMLFGYPQASRNLETIGISNKNNSKFQPKRCWHWSTLWKLFLLLQKVAGLMWMLINVFSLMHGRVRQARTPFSWLKRPRIFSLSYQSLKLCLSHLKTSNNPADGLSSRLFGLHSRFSDGTWSLVEHTFGGTFGHSFVLIALHTNDVIGRSSVCVHILPPFWVSTRRASICFHRMYWRWRICLILMFSHRLVWWVRFKVPVQLRSPLLFWSFVGIHIRSLS